jgi:two-component system nitrate/nitrite response regulator NarL
MDPAVYNSFTVMSKELTNVRVLIVSLDRLFRAGLAVVLDQQPDLVVVGQIAGDEDSSLPLGVYDPDVIVWDVSWETASASRNLELLPDNPPPVLVLATTEEQTTSARLVGVKAFISRNASPDALAAAVNALSHGLMVTDPTVSPGFGDSVSNSSPSLAALLTARETDVLKLVAEGLPNKGVASRLEVSEHTVKFHVNSIMGKLNAQSRTEAVTLATRLGFLPV